MAEQALTHWKKNIDSRYISGEDLKAELHGLKPEMVVVIEKFQDAETFDQKKQEKAVKTGFFLKEVGGTILYKPVLLNGTNAKFCAKEFGSDFMENWIGKPFVMYACPDSRFGFVVRFKKYYPPVIKPDKAIEALSKATTLDGLAAAWTSLTADEKLLKVVMDKKEELKLKLSEVKK
jgi:hypothetical protein